MKYRLTYEVRSVRGSQVYLVDADSEEDALSKHEAGESELECEELDVQSLHKDPDIEEIKP